MAVAVELWNLLTVGNVLLSLLLLLLLHYLIELYEFRGMPPGPRLYTIPFFGNFLSFDSGSGLSLRESTQSLMKQYGKVFSLRLGSFKVVVAASADSVKEVLVKRSAAYAGRPPFHTFHLLTLGGKDIAIGNYGPAWKLHRKLFVTALRQYLKDAPLVESRVTEQTKRVLEYIDQQKGKPFDPADILASSVANVICGVTFGDRFNSFHPDFDMLLGLTNSVMGDEDINEIAAFWDFFPLAKFLPIGIYKRVVERMDRVRDILRRQLREVEEVFNPNEPISDLITSLVKVRNEAEMEDKEDKAILMSSDYLVNTIQDMFIAGYETTSTTLRWAIAYLTNYPEYQTKIQQELDDVVGCDRLPSLDDRPKLPFFQAVIMEIQRLGNIVDNAIPHYTLVDTTLCGYRVPKDTVVLSNIEAVHLDPECWENPEDFNPYRHIDAAGMLITDPENWLPFSAGRRVCAGESLAKVELFLFLSILLQHYTFVPEEGKHPPILKGAIGLFIKRPEPYSVSLIKRD